MRAVDADARTRIYVQLPMDHDGIAAVNRDVCRQGCVVVDLEPLTGGRFDLETLVAARLHRVGEHSGVEGDLGSVAGVEDVLVKGLVIGGVAAAASWAADEKDGHGRERKGATPVTHSARACSSESLPS